MKQLTYLLILTSLHFFAQNRKGNLHLTPNSESHELYISIKPSINLNPEDFNKDLIQLIPEMKSLITEYGIHFEKGINISEDKLKFLSSEAFRLTKNDVSIQKLRNILKIKINNPTNQKLWELAEKLEALKDVEYCSLMTLTPIAPPTDIPPTTSNYELNQTYFGANPGVNMNYAHGLGLSGNGIRVRDVEYGFNHNHEDLNEVNASIAPGMTISPDATSLYTEHGTSVFGIVMGHKDTYGTTGLAYNAQEMVLFPEWQEIGYDRVNAVSEAITASQAGDVIIYEMQTYGQGNNYVLAEFDNPIWDLTKAATDAGIIIVAAAGNGNQNLDSAYYTSYRARGNSGAIIVGGGRSNTTHNRISYSTYGARVDVQGWSENVFTCGYGDSVLINNDMNQGYTNFSGTSSATPMVASCVVVLQSYYHNSTGSFMSPSEMNTLLKNTGTPQGSGVSGHIGPLPNMQAAIQQIQGTLTVDDESQLQFSVFPNPAEDHLTINLPESVSGKTSVELYDNLGRSLFFNPEFIKEIQIDLSNFPTGMYFIKITSENKTATRKFLKK
ncbi:S8 family peptidase [Flavobacterium amniphilum]|uniref:S8/S53 family peptidase n=1 Tax=Flavobacterium amniphilum TaxID=1834035 RepID=UPI002029C94F|nr:S8/S53 family peptidase [Flavobacterium amniphilum]MCL9806157.1 S8 family peptidase [Flavobacterium amniphilum]